MRFLFEVCGLRVICGLSYQIHIKPENAPFLQEISPDAPLPATDAALTFLPASHLPAGWERGHFAGNHYYLTFSGERRIYFCNAPGNPPYACTVHRSGSRDWICKYLAHGVRYMDYSTNLMEFLSFESFLLEHQALLLHSALIRVYGKGVLFSAPSGTGKSTQADLWAGARGADILNGDRAGLRQTDGVWTAYGLPFAGSSGIYRNESAPIAAIVALRQAPHNQIRPMNRAEAFRFLYPQLTVHQWEPDSVAAAADLLLELLDQVPVFLLECRPDLGAVEAAEQAIFPERSV